MAGPGPGGVLRPVHPRTRGEHVKCQVDVVLPLRFIPAHAGNMVKIKTCSDNIPVHPRTRGEHESQNSVGCAVLRFIPAHAGNMTHTTNKARYITVHPRTRGEHAAETFKLKRYVGSSPHTRGTSSPESFRPSNTRFIPAHAGNMPDTSALPNTRAGSSPHTRGTYFSQLAVLYDKNRVEKFYRLFCGIRLP